ncbi:MAG: O-antigen ligase family protein [Treponema sp.]|nr:O-antigen ligase family protein [Treponema sp.]
MTKTEYEQSKLSVDKKNNAIINRVMTKIASTFFITITAIYPLFLGVGGYGAMHFRKTMFFWIATGIVSLVLLFMLLCVKERFSMEYYYTENQPLRRITIAEWAVLGFISLALISATVSVTQNPTWINRRFAGAIVWFGENNRYEGFITFLCYVMTFVIIARFYKPKRLHLLLLSGSTILISLYGVLQFLGIDILGLFPFGDVYGPLAAPLRTTLGNINFVSAYCAFAVMLFSALFTISRSKWKCLYLGAGALSFALSLTTGFSGDAHRIAILGTMVLLIPYWISSRERLGRILITLSSWCVVYIGYNTYMTEMRRQYETGRVFPTHDHGFVNAYTPPNFAVLAIMALSLLAAGLALILLLKKWVAEKRMIIAGAVLIPVMLISSLIALEVIGSRLYDRPYSAIWQARELMHGRIDDDFGSNRGWIWRNAVEIIPDNPILGTGSGTFFHALGRDRQLEAVERYNHTVDKAHNAFLQIAVCMGIPALIAYIIFLGSVFIPAIKRAFKRPILLAFGAAALSYIIQSFFMVEVPIVTPLLWVALGVMASELWMAKIRYKSMEV